MTVVYERFGVTVHHGDCLDVLPTLPDASFDSVVCDPPYELSFMGKSWDSSGIAFNPTVWRECLRVLKPGGHLMAFGGSRTWHRLAVAIEDAGFELRDSIAWLYGSGFPKSMDVAKAIDKARDDRMEIVRVTSWLSEQATARGVTRAQVDAHMGTSDMAGWWLTTLPHRCQCPTWQQWQQLRELIDFGDEMDAEVWRLNGRKGKPGEAWDQREVIGQGHRVRRESSVQIAGLSSGAFDLTAAASEASRHWEGWGTTLKPAFEPIVVARKPLSGRTVAANVLAHGTGALHIDACRTAAGQDYRDKCASVVGLDSNRNGDAYGEWTGVRQDSAHQAGRWPTNVVLDNAAANALDEQSGISTSTQGARRGQGANGYAGGALGAQAQDCGRGDSGGASRFFPVFHWEAKAPTSERPKVNGVAHPTVKPLALMRWLVRLVTPLNGVVLDPFLGSGTTAQAARAEGFRCIGIERETAHLDLIRARLDARPATEADGKPAAETYDLLDLLDVEGP